MRWIGITRRFTYIYQNQVELLQIWLLKLWFLNVTQKNVHHTTFRSKWPPGEDSENVVIQPLYYGIWASDRCWKIVRHSSAVPLDKHNNVLESHWWCLFSAHVKHQIHRNVTDNGLDGGKNDFNTPKIGREWEEKNACGTHSSLEMCYLPKILFKLIQIWQNNVTLFFSLFFSSYSWCAFSRYYSILVYQSHFFRFRRVSFNLKMW